MTASRRWLWVGLAAIAAALIFGGGAVIVIQNEKDRVRAALRKWAVLGNLDPDFVEAIGVVENGLRLSATNTSGRDGELGGSYGPTQITMQTARANGYAGPMQAFNEDPELAGQWTARILNEHRQRGELVTLADYVAAWNAGRDHADRNGDNELEELPATNTARTQYLPRAKVALAAIYQRNSEAA
jgi:hypothetical protein